MRTRTRVLRKIGAPGPRERYEKMKELAKKVKDAQAELENYQDGCGCGGRV